MSSEQIVTTITMRRQRLDVEAICAFADLLREQDVRPTAPVHIKLHHGQRDQVEAVDLICTVTH